MIVNEIDYGFWCCCGLVVIGFVNNMGCYCYWDGVECFEGGEIYVEVVVVCVGFW